MTERQIPRRFSTRSFEPVVSGIGGRSPQGMSRTCHSCFFASS